MKIYAQKEMEDIILPGIVARELNVQDTVPKNEWSFFSSINEVD